MKKKLRIRKSGDRGFSLIELMFAVAVLATAVIGSMVMVVIGIGRTGSNRMDTTATNVAQTVLEDIATAPPPLPPGPGVPATVPPPLSITDCTGNALAITTAVGGAPLSPSGNGDIDFQSPVPAAYQVNYTMCGTNGLRAVYDVRWRIDPVDASGFARLITVAARQPMSVRNGTLVYIPPVTLRTIVGQ
jgi:prepilin-type N-terminal cleavage/methylation domain-containing protein